MMYLNNQFQINDDFWQPYQSLVKEHVIPYQEQVLHDAIEGIEKSHAIENFRLAAKKLATNQCDETFYGMCFQDSDVAKWLEAAAYSLKLYPDTSLESRCDQLIELIGQAQWSDGYLNTYFTVKEPSKRWTNLEEAHELYCAGHMIEAGVAYYEATNKKELLNIIIRLADHIYNQFITQKKEGFPGHPEIELALIRLYQATENNHYKILAEHFVNVRGVDPDYYNKERKANNWSVWGQRSENPDLKYSQAHLPVRDQETADGHAVRAVYLYSAMADIAHLSKDPTLMHACETLWDNIHSRRMYVTGAIGSAYQGEAFTTDYHLPNETAYAETCAAIGLIFFSRRMLKLKPHSKYADLIERSLYNAVLPGIAMDGKKFFYVNPHESIPGITDQAATHHHVKAERPSWYSCACCPPNIARLLTSLSSYAYQIDDDTVFAHLFVGGNLDLSSTNNGSIQCTSQFPYQGSVQYRFNPTGENMSVRFAIRIPEWSRVTTFKLNDTIVEPNIIDGYALFDNVFIDGDTIDIDFDMSIKQIYANTNIPDNSHKVAIRRGPLIYCAEGADNAQDVLSYIMDTKSPMTTFESKAFKNVLQIECNAYTIESSEFLYSYDVPKKESNKLILTPYYTWANRGENQMRLWLPYFM